MSCQITAYVQQNATEAKEHAAPPHVVAILGSAARKSVLSAHSGWLTSKA